MRKMLFNKAWWFSLKVAGLTIVLLSQTLIVEAFDLQGHRGARGLMPENTLPAFARALSIGVSTLELDTGVTRDGIVVVSHNSKLDKNLTRDKTSKWLAAEGPAINSLTYDEIKIFDVGRIKPGSRYAKRFSDQTAIDGTVIPTLDQVFELVKRSGNTTVRFNIETKLQPQNPGLTPPPLEFARAVLKVIRRNKMETRVTLQSFDWRTLREMQRLEPKISTSYLSATQSWLDNLKLGRPGPSPWTAGFDLDDFQQNVPKAIKAAGGKIWSPFHKEVTKDQIDLAHKLGLKVKVWTVNDKRRMIELIKMGVDGIITDYPDRLRAILEMLKMPLPAKTPVIQ